MTDPENANDLDIAIDGIDGFDFYIFGGKLEMLLKIPVDIIPLNIENKFINQILKSGKCIYEKCEPIN